MSNHVLALDLETTGLDFKTGSIIEIGAIHYNGHEVVSTFDLKFPAKTNSTVSLGALKVNKRPIDSVVTYNDVANADGLKEFVKWLMTSVVPKVGDKAFQILGHNVAFDVTWLRYALEEIGITGWSEIFNHRVRDTAAIGEFLREAGVLEMDKMSLTNLAISLKVPVVKEALHGAFYDAKLSAMCYFAMKELMRVNYGKSK